MSAHEEQFENHGIHDVISQLESALQKKSSKDLPDDALDNLDRIRQATAFIRGRVEIASPLLTPKARLDQIQKSLQASLNEVNQFQSNSNAAHLANASNQIDAGLNQAATVISLEQPEPSIKAKDAVSFKSLAEEIIESLREKAGEIEGQAETIESKLQKLDATSQEQKAVLETLQSTLDSKLQELESKFSAEQTERSSQFDSHLQRIQQAADEKVASISEAADENLETLAEKQSEAERIVSLIGNIGLTGNFKGAATREKQAADRLRSIALVCFLGMVGVVLATLFIAVKDGFDPWLALFRLGAGLTLIIPAAYAARESSRHRTLENKNRRAELELASIDAYLESLPAEKRTEIKAALTDKFFGQPSEDSNSDEDSVSSNTLAKLLRDAINELGKR